MTELDTLCYISEMTASPDDQMNFNYKVIDKGTRFFVIFDAVLQSFGCMNRNNRMYDLNNVVTVVNTDPEIQDKLRRNVWMGEREHPAVELEGQQLTVQRIAKVDPKNTSHYIRKPRVNGNLYEGTIQTDSSNESGMGLAIQIVDGKIIPGFSARLLGALSNVNNQPMVNVKKLITYDAVTYPSHKEALAKFTQPVQESIEVANTHFSVTIIPFLELAKSAANNSKETTWLCEAFGLTTDNIIGLTDTGNSVVINENKNVYIQPLSDKNLRSKTKRILTDWINQ